MMFKVVGLGQVMVAIGFLLIAVVMMGCGDVALAMDPDAGDMGEAGGGGSMTGAGGGPGGAAGAGDVGGESGTGGTVCVENTRADCRAAGQVVLGGSYICRDDGFDADPSWGTCGADGKITGGDYAGLACPFDVAAEYSDSVTSCPEAVGWRTSPGSVSWCSWRNTVEAIYCCDGTAVRKIARCK